jgi:uridine kinase
MARVVLLAGPSGSGKSRVARLARRPELALDDFYRDLDHPGLPIARGLVDWDDAASWDADAAFAVVEELCRTGRADVPRYDIATSRRVGTVHLALDGAECFVAEGLFAPDLVPRCADAGLPFDALYLSRPRTLSLLLRFVRDVREHRKPIPILIRRGLALWRSEPRLRTYALTRGCRPVTLRKALAVIGRDDTLWP